MHGLVGDPEVRGLTEAARERILVEFNDSARPYRSGLTLVDLCAAQARTSPDAIAVSWESAAGELESLTYAELHERADRRARRLRNRGVGPGVAVGIALLRSSELVISVLAVLKAGGYYVPIDPEYPSDRISYMLEDSGVRVLITTWALEASLPEAATAIAMIAGDDSDDVVIDIARPARVEPGPDDFVYMIYTSGSTGRPKGALNRHRGIVNRLQWMQERYDATPRDVVLFKTPFGFDESVWELFWPLISGAQLFIARPGGHRDPGYLVDLIARRHVSIVHFVPSVLRLIVATEGLEACTSLRHVVASGEALPGDLVTALYARSEAEIHNLYGPTEAAVDVTHFTCPRDLDVTNVPIGRPVANTQIYILDEAMQPVPIGALGEIYIGGAQVGAGYHGQDDLTERAFVRDPFTKSPDARLYRSGDLASFDEQGLVHFAGRLDSQVKIDGIRIELDEIESHLRKHPGVRDAAIVVHGTPADPHLVAYVVSDDASEQVDAIRESLASELPGYMVPRIVSIEELPLSPNGKLDRSALPDPWAVPPAREPESHTNLLYYELCAMWEDVLGVPHVGIRDDFFELGGRSITAARAVGLMSKRFGRRLPMDRFFEDPTIVAVAALLLEDDGAPSPPVLALNAGGTKTPFFFVDGDMNGGGYYVRELARRLGEDRPLYALHMPGTNGTPVPASVEEMAREYVDLIKSIRPIGPYVLGGYCNGTLLAHEIARQLQKRNDRVLKLVFVESLGSNASVARLTKVVDAALRIGFSSMERRASVRRAIGLFATRYRQSAGSRQTRLGSLSKAWQLLSRSSSAAPVASDEGDTPEMLEWHRRAAEYVPRRFFGAIDVLMSEETLAKGAAGTSQWNHVSRRVNVSSIPGGHQTCITRHVETMAEAVHRSLTRV